MARRGWWLAVLAVALVASAGGAWADTLGFGSPVYREGSGGEFRVTSYDYDLPWLSTSVTTTANSFYTFCLERNENVSAPTGTPATYAYTIDTDALMGGYNHNNGSGNGATPGNPDPVNANTAKLYYTFWTNQWSGTGITYAYGDLSDGGQRGLDGRDLQYAIWYMEGEITTAEWNGYLAGAGAGGQAAAMVAYANNVSWSDLGQGSWTSTDHGVRALNLWTVGSGAAVQSHLVVVPLPPAVLMGLALLSVLGVSFFVRRRQRLSLN